MMALTIAALSIIPALSVAEQVSAAIAENVTVQEALVLMEENATKLIILDVRTPGEYAAGCLEGAINLDYYAQAFRTDLEKLPRDAVILIYCASGRRSEATMAILVELGFGEVYNLRGGINAWIGENQPVVVPEPNHGQLEAILAK